MAEDPIDILIRMLRRARMIEKRIASLAGSLWWEYWGEAAERLMEEVESSMREGVVEPLFRVEDLGDELAILIDLAGAGDDVTVRVYRDRVEVEAELRREAVEATVGREAWRAVARRYRASITLPHPVDPSTARYEKRRGLLVIYVKKEG